VEVVRVALITGLAAVLPQGLTWWQNRKRDEWEKARHAEEVQRDRERHEQQADAERAARSRAAVGLFVVAAAEFVGVYGASTLGSATHGTRERALTLIGPVRATAIDTLLDLRGNDRAFETPIRDMLDGFEFIGTPSWETLHDLAEATRKALDDLRGWL